MNTTEPLDPAAVMAAHTGWHACGPFDEDRLTHPEGGCEPYRLAAELAAAQEREQRVLALCTDSLESSQYGEQSVTVEAVNAILQPRPHSCAAFVVPAETLAADLAGDVSTPA